MKKFFLLFLVTVVFTTTSLAQVFSDLPDGHWAQKVVEEMVSSGIISGYSDGTFRPLENLSKIHSLLLISRVAGINNNSSAASKYASQYATSLSKYSTQYKTEIAYLLGTGILKETELDMFIGDNVANEGLTREEMAILVTKVLKKEEEAVGKSLIVLSFADTSEISAKAKPYVYYVNSQGYMNGIPGDKFGPKMILTRGQAAATLQRIYKKVSITPDVTPTPAKTTTSFLTGTITKINTAESSVEIKDSTGKTEEYEYDSKTEFYIGSKQKTSAAMATKATVTVTISNNEYITVMNISSGATVDSTTISGTIKDYNTTKKTISILKSSKTYTYTYDTSTKFTLEGKTSTAAKVLVSSSKGKEITATVEDDSYLLTAKVVSKTIIGQITYVNKSDGYVEFTDEDDDDYIIMDDKLEEYDDDYDYYYDDDTDYYYNGSDYKYSTIASSSSYLYKKDNYIQITLNDDYITELRVASKKSSLEESSSTVETIIGEITDYDDDEYYVEIEDEDGDIYIAMDDYENEYDDGDEDYYYDDDTKFYYNGSSYTYSKISSYLYEDGYYVKFTLDGDYIEKLEVASTKSKLSSGSSSNDISNGFVSGYITDWSDDYIDIEDDDGNDYSFEIDNNCIILDGFSKDPEDDLYTYDEDELDEDDEVMIFVYDEDDDDYYTRLIILLD